MKMMTLPLFRTKVFSLGFGTSLVILSTCVIYAAFSPWLESVFSALEPPYPYVSFPVGLRYGFLAYVMLNLLPALVTSLLVMGLDMSVAVPAPLKAVGVLVVNILLSALWWYSIAAVCQRVRSNQER